LVEGLERKQTGVWRRRFGAKESEKVLRLAEALTVDTLMSLQDVDE